MNSLCIRLFDRQNNVKQNSLRNNRNCGLIEAIMIDFHAEFATPIHTIPNCTYGI